MQMLLTSQWGGVCSKKSLVLMRGQKFEKQTLWLKLGDCLISQIHVESSDASVGSSNKTISYCTSSLPCISLVSLADCTDKRKHTCDKCFLRTRSSHPTMNLSTATKRLLLPIAWTLDSISFSSPLRNIDLRILFIYLSICQHVVQKVDETASSLPFM